MSVWRVDGVATCRSGEFTEWRLAGVSTCRSGELSDWRIDLWRIACGELPEWRDVCKAVRVRDRVRNEFLARVRDMSLVVFIIVLKFITLTITINLSLRLTLTHPN
jgi:hypothetical protein